MDSASLEIHRSGARRAWDVGDGIVLVASGLPVPIHGTDGFHGFHVHGDHAGERELAEGDLVLVDAGAELGAP